jgi:hypothetical protein
MAKKQERVPGMRSNVLNRAQRRGSQPQEGKPPTRETSERASSQEVASVRAKSSGHRKKTADNWNQ